LGLLLASKSDGARGFDGIHRLTRRRQEKGEMPGRLKKSGKFTTMNVCRMRGLDGIPLIGFGVGSHFRDRALRASEQSIPDLLSVLNVGFLSAPFFVNKL
jgi:hypothetical protein